LVVKGGIRQKKGGRETRCFILGNVDERRTLSSWGGKDVERKKPRCREGVNKL